MNDDATVEIVVDDGDGKNKKEYIAERVDPSHDAVQRRSAYDAHLKTDILFSGRENSMNATFDPYYYN